MNKSLKVLTLEPYYGGSHKAFLEGWMQFSHHKWTLLSLPPWKWKWRMRHSAITLANQTVEKIRTGEQWDIIFCSDMLNLAEYLGLVPQTVQKLPSIVYFHENQLTYPVAHPQEFDFHYVLTNLITALAATKVWFNSSYHQNIFLDELRDFLKRMPDFQPLKTVDDIRSKSMVRYPGIHQFPNRKERSPGPMRIVWAARWEHDKNPKLFFDALRILKDRKIEFRISVIGEQFRQVPDVFNSARHEFSNYIDRWGYQQERQDYESVLLKADIFVSTADHEFFGISVLEGVAAGAFPLVPDKLAYPETLERDSANDDFYFNGKADQLAERLAQLSETIRNNNLWNGDPDRAIRIVEKFFWKTKANLLDKELYKILERSKKNNPITP
ncbi:MAG: tRNA-queuosine alpha-mannosyltransferase domain-containing protein [Planctomycetota bacterium]|jgi:glycosyltransferase involved in cell wall biosynthesis